jgi:hypothetical protein
MQKFLRKCIIYLFVSLIIINGIAFFLDNQIRNSNIFKVNILMNSSHLPPNIVLGSSRALTSIDTKLLSELTGMKWYNMSVDDTPIETHLLIYQLLVESGNTPEIVLLQYDRERSKDVKLIHEKDYQFMPFALHGSEAIKKYLAEKENGLAYTYLPVLKYTTFNTELVFSFLKLLLNNDYMHRFDKYGDYSYPQNFSYHSDCDGKKTFSPDFSDLTLKTLTSFCEKNGTKLIVFTAPYRCRNLSPNFSTPVNYLDYTSLFESDSCFYDEQHLNMYGKEALTKKTGADLNSYFNK